jgi:hypothetical protein
LLYELHTVRANEPADKFPRSERLRFAFKIAECGLFLCGTSWLADLKSSNVRRSAKDLEQSRHFLLDTKASQADFNDDHFRQFAEHAFAIGVLLTEIGTGRLIARIPARPKHEGQGFVFHRAPTATSAEPEDKTGAEVYDMLRITMGDDYAKPVKICLESKESWRQAIRHTAAQREEIYQKMLVEYYSDVYSP